MHFSWIAGSTTGYYVHRNMTGVLLVIVHVNRSVPYRNWGKLNNQNIVCMSMWSLTCPDVFDQGDSVGALTYADVA